MNTIKKLPLTQENFAESMSQMIDVLAELKFTPAEINLTNLLVEETFSFWEEAMTNFTSPVNMSIYKRLGETRISLRLKGNPYNPLAVTAEESDDEIFSARLAILKANRDRILYTYKNGENIITIIAHRISDKKKKLIYTVVAMVLGISTGFLMQTFLPAETIQSIDFATDMVRKIFLQLLNMLVAPVTFFSILSGLSQMSDANDAGRIGSRLALVTVSMMLVMSFLSMISGIFCFSEDLSFMRMSMVVDETVSEEKYFSFMNMLAGMKPSIPCAGIICLTYLFDVMTIPAEAVTVVLGIEPIMALFIAVCNVVSNTAVAFVVARKENAVDLNIYNK